ncbi:MAG: hypothetical protein QOK17_689 [Sphingomonadales bacterium]|jgi:hypothetical protein|nr:hypothetical protein [Sphingomonadales bacterium]
MAMLAAALIALVATILICAVLFRVWPSTEKVAAIAQSALTAAAILLAGFWYFVERKAMPHAELHLEARGVHLQAGLALVALRIDIKNGGSTVLHAAQWDVRLLSIVPTKLPLSSLAALGRDEWPESENAYYDQELRWDVLRAFRGSDDHAVEPGESDIKAMDFIVPCTYPVLRATAALKRPQARGREERLERTFNEDTSDDWWWKDRALIDLQELCRKPVGFTADVTVAAERENGK